MTNFKKAKTLYVSHEDAEYGIFCFNEEGDLFLNSDWGMYGFAWRHYGDGTFESFLAGTNAEYIAGKFENNFRIEAGQQLSKNTKEMITILIGRFIEELNKQETEKKAKPTEEFRHCNHYHEMGDDHQLVDFGEGEFVANNDAVPLLKALNEIGLNTRTHHIEKGENSFVSILIDDVETEERIVNEGHADRDKYNGKKELLISFKAKA